MITKFESFKPLPVLDLSGSLSHADLFDALDDDMVILFEFRGGKGNGNFIAVTPEEKKILSDKGFVTEDNEINVEDKEEILKELELIRSANKYNL
jgi:hypothetical protein